MKTFLLLFLLSNFNYAQEDSCNHSHHPQIENLADIAKQLNWEAVSVANIRSAPCTKKTPYSVEEMTNWLKAHQSPMTKAKKIHGISFEGESPENLATFELLTTFKTFFGEPDPKNQKTFSSQCKKVDCAVKEIFGPKTGIQLLFMHRKFGMNGSHLITANRSSWKSSELDHVLLSLSDYPPGLLPAEPNRPLTHFKRGYLPGYASENVIANASIEVFDLWDEQSPEEKRYAIVHELGHNLGGLAGRADESSKWLKMSGWTKETKVINGEKVTDYKATKPESIISKYGFTNPAEDFAESVSAYRYNPKKLKSISPEKYNFIKEVIFDNVEYTSEEACKNPKRISDSYVKQAETLISNWQPSTQEIKSIASKCSSAAISELSSHGSISVSSSSMKACYETAFNNQAKEIAKGIFKNHPNKDYLGPILKNAKIKPIPTTKLTGLIQSAQPLHRDLLRSSLKQGLVNTDYVGPDSKKADLQFFYQAVPNSIGFDPFSKKNEFQVIASKAVNGINNNGSLRRWINMDFSESEVNEQVNKMIK